MSSLHGGTRFPCPSVAPSLGYSGEWMKNKAEAFSFLFNLRLEIGQFPPFPSANVQCINILMYKIQILDVLLAKVLQGINRMSISIYRLITYTFNNQGTVKSDPHRYQIHIKCVN